MNHPRTRSLAFAAVVGIGSGACGRLLEFRVGVSARSASCFTRSHTNTMKRRHSCHHWAKSRSSCSASGCRLSHKLLCVHLFVRCCLLVTPLCLRLVDKRQVADSFGCVRQGNCAVCVRRGHGCQWNNLPRVVGEPAVRSKLPLARAELFRTVAVAGLTAHFLPRHACLPTCLLLFVLTARALG